MPPPWLDILFPSRTNRLRLWDPSNMDQGVLHHRCCWTRYRTVTAERSRPKWRSGQVRGSRQRRASLLCRQYRYGPLISHQTVGTLLTGAYSTGGCLLGAIFGTGTNGAYVEDRAALKKLSGNTAVPGDGQKMVINCEWGAFDNAVSFPTSSIKGNLLDRPYRPIAKNSPSVSIRHKTRSRIHQSVCVPPPLGRTAKCIHPFQAQTSFRENDFWYVSR